MMSNRNTRLQQRREERRAKQQRRTILAERALTLGHLSRAQDLYDGATRIGRIPSRVLFDGEGF